MKVPFDTLSGLHETIKRLRYLFLNKSHPPFNEFKAVLKGFGDKEVGELNTLLNALFDYDRSLSLLECEVE